MSDERPAEQPLLDAPGPAEETSTGPITGVAAGNLGTAANLDDTQVFRTEDLLIAPAARPSGSQDAGAFGNAEQRRNPSGHGRTVGGGAAVAARRARRLPVVAGAAALLVLALVGGVGILSQLDLGTAQGGGGSSTPLASPTAPASTPDPAPRSGNGSGGGNGGGHGNGGCHGNGKGNGGCNHG